MGTNKKYVGMDIHRMFDHFESPYEGMPSPYSIISNMPPYTWGALVTLLSTHNGKFIKALENISEYNWWARLLYMSIDLDDHKHLDPTPLDWDEHLGEWLGWQVICDAFDTAETLTKGKHVAHRVVELLEKNGRLDNV